METKQSSILMREEERENAEVQKAEYTIGNRTYSVTRHFGGKRDLQSLVMELAITRAKRDVKANTTE